MEEKKGYDVLRIIAHSDRCYMSTDYIRGKPLIIWLKYHPRIGKEQLYRWIRELLEELRHFYQCRGNSYYQYVNPYSIIVGEGEKLYLLDLGSKAQGEMIHLMQRRYVRENFLSPENQYYQKASVQEDIYGLGKTIQYLLSAATVEPSLGRLEEFRFRRIITRCLRPNSKKSYQSVQEISQHFPNQRSKREYGTASRRKLLAAAALFIGAAAVTMQFAETRGLGQKREEEENLAEEQENLEEMLADYHEELQRKEEQWEEEKQAVEAAALDREKELVYELALVYFIELEDYSRSREALGSIEEKDGFARDFSRLCAFLEEEDQTEGGWEIEQLLGRMEDALPDEEDERYASCIERGYQALEERKAAQNETEEKKGE